MTLLDLGWSDFFQEAFAEHEKAGLVPARLIRDNNVTQGALIIGERGRFEEHEVIVSGKLYHDAKADAELPAVGDWVGLDFSDESDFPVIRARLPRRSTLSRKAAGKSSEEQVIAANVDIVCVVTDALVDLNARRLERYFAIIERGGARPIVLLNKADLCTTEQLSAATAAIREIHPEVPIHTLSAIQKRSLGILAPLFSKGVTIAFIGSSGVGKSALVNGLLGGEYQWTGEVDEGTGKGRHTTTARELMVLRKGGIIVDNPGIKEIQMWTDESTLRDQFSDISALASQCKYLDCKHGTDADCAIRQAVQAGGLSPERYAGFLKLEQEIAELLKRRSKRQMTLERRHKRVQKSVFKNREDHRSHQAHLRPHKQRDMDAFD